MQENELNYESVRKEIKRKLKEIEELIESEQRTPFHVLFMVNDDLEDIMLNWDDSPARGFNPFLDEAF
jgi:RNase P protein component